MIRPRSYDEHLQLYSAFAVAVSSFSTETWNRISARCATFSDESVGAAFERARLRAIAFGFPTGRLPANMPLVPTVVTGAIAGVSAVFQTGLAFGFELSQLVPEWRDGPMPVRSKNTGKPRLDRLWDAVRLIDVALDSLPGPSLGVRAAIQAAGTAVLFHDFLSDDDFMRSYGVWAAEISFADLEHRAIII